MREKGSDYFVNTRRAVDVRREYAQRNPYEFNGYGGDCWGFTASDGPGFQMLKVDGKNCHFLGYGARGVPYGPDDGTIGPCAALASLPFAPELGYGRCGILAPIIPTCSAARECRAALSDLSGSRPSVGSPGIALGSTRASSLSDRQPCPG